MSKILKRPMFRKGGSVEEGIIKLATGGRAKYADGPGPVIDPNNPVLQKARENKAILEAMTGGTRDTKQDFYDFLISGGINLAGGVGAGDGTIASIARSFKEPTEKFLAKRPGEEDFQRKLGLTAGQAAISGDSNKTKQDRLLYLSDLKSQIEQKRASGVKLNRSEENRLKAIDIEIFKLNRDPYLKEASPGVKIEDLARKIEKEEGRNLKVGSGKNMATTKFKMEQGEIIDPRNNKPLTNYADRSLRPNEIIPQGDGSIAIANPDKIVQQTLKTSLSPNTIYITQQEGYLYLYEGNNKFRRIYP